MKRRDFLKISGIATIGTVLFADSLILQGKNLLKNNNGNLIFNISNKSSTETKRAMLFGTFRDMTDANKDKDIKIDVLGSTHLQIKNQLLNSPLRILGITLKADDVRNFENPLELCSTNSIGMTVSTLFQPLNYRSARDLDVKMITSSCFELILTPEVYIYLNVAPQSYINIEFLIEKENLALRNIIKPQYLNKEYFL